MVADALDSQPASISCWIDAKIDGDRLVIQCRGRLLGVWMIVNGRFGWIPPAFLLPSTQRDRICDVVEDTLVWATLKNQMIRKIDGS
jgi:hypothetical protein